MRRILILVFFSLFINCLLFSAYDENKFMQAGKEMIAKKQYDKAIKIFNYIIKQNPKNTNAIVFAAFAYMKNGDKVTTKKYLEAAYKISNDPKIKKMIDDLVGQQPDLAMKKQVSAPQTFKQLNLGIKTGINLANISGDSSESSSIFIGLCIGGLVSYSFTPWIAMQPEFYYTEKGTISETSNDKSVLYLSYIEIPLLLKLSIPLGVFTPIIYAGPAFSIATEAIVETELKMNDVWTKNRYSIKDDINLTDFGIVAGAGFEIKAGPGAITFDVRYDMGMSTIYNIEGIDKQPDVKTTAITILAGYLF